MVDIAFGQTARDLTSLRKCQLPNNPSPASHPDDRRDEKQRCLCVGGEMLL